MADGHGWVNDRLYYNEQDIRNILEYGHSVFAEDIWDVIGERADIWRAKKFLKINKANDGTNRQLIADYLNKGDNE